MSNWRDIKIRDFLLSEKFKKQQETVVYDTTTIWLHEQNTGISTADVLRHVLPPVCSTRAPHLAKTKQGLSSKWKRVWHGQSPVVTEMFCQRMVLDKRSWGHYDQKGSSSEEQDSNQYILTSRQP